MKRLKFVGLITFGVMFSGNSHADDFNVSAKSDFLENPFVATGFDARKNITTGYLEALRTSPGRTDVCKLLFSEDPKRKNYLKIVYFMGGEESRIAASLAKDHEAILERNKSGVRLVFKEKDMDGDCDWILPFVGEPIVEANGGTVAVLVSKRNVGDWTSVHAIKSQRAYFHQKPEKESIKKSFLVAWDVIYVYDETVDWYYVKYNGRKKESTGWIRKEDVF
jgi:hypothetical protein